MYPIKRNYKTSHVAPRTDKRRLTKTTAILFSYPRIVVNDIMKGTPTHDRSLKWLKVTFSMQKCSHTFQEASYSKRSTRNKTLPSLKAIFLENPLNSQFCGYTIPKAFAGPLKNSFYGFF